MSPVNHTIKRYNHRVHPCSTEQKQNLLKHLVDFYKDKSILVISDANTKVTEIEDKNMTLCDDDALREMGDKKWDVLISFDLPKDPQEYIDRLPFATIMALIIADDKEQQTLFLIETLLGKNLTRETIEDFADLNIEAKQMGMKAQEQKRWNMPQKPNDKPSKPYDKKKNATYIGKDENGKPLFSAKSKDRNHRYDGTPRTEEEKRAQATSKRPKRSINVNSLKPKADAED